MRSGFVFYRSWFEAVKNLPREMQGEVLTSIIEYGLNGETTGSLKPITSAMLAMVKPQIDANNKRMENGSKGGRPCKATSAEEQSCNQVVTEQEPNNNQTKTKPKPKETKPKPKETKPKPNQNQTEPKEKDKEEDKEKENSTSVESKKDAAKAATLLRKETFYQILVPYVGQYTKEMIRSFFDYWSELNRSGTKMRYELEKTWELSKRLATWASRERMPVKVDTGMILTNNSTEKYNTPEERKWEERWKQ